ncbi:MAG: site-2 protease family protein [Phycisphaerales bacterium]
MDIGIIGIYNNLGPAAAAAFLFWVIFSITMHELAHGWAALWQGDDTPRIYGRMTLNPVVHMGWVSLILLAVIGIAWGMMPVDPSKYRWGRRGRIIVSLAGPAMNVVLSLLCWGGLGLLLRDGIATQGTEFQLENFLYLGGRYNAFFAMLSLLPVPPLDGARALAGISRTYYRWSYDPRAAMAGISIVLIALFSGVGGLMVHWADRMGVDLASWIGRLGG